MVGQAGFDLLHVDTQPRQAGFGAQLPGLAIAALIILLLVEFLLETLLAAVAAAPLVAFDRRFDMMGLEILRVRFFGVK